MVLQVACLTEEFALLSLPRTRHVAIPFTNSSRVVQPVWVMNNQLLTTTTAALTLVFSSRFDTPTLCYAVTCRPTRVQDRLGVFYACGSL